MNAYITSLITISIIGGLLSNLVSSFSSIKKYVNYFIGLIAVICMLSPLISLVKNLSFAKEKINDFFDGIANEEIINNSNNLIITTGIDSVKNGIKNTIIEKFDFDENEVIVELETDQNDIEAIKITKVKVTLTGKASWSDVDKVKEYLIDIIGGEISVVRKWIYSKSIKTRLLYLLS